MISDLSEREKVLVWATVGAFVVALFFGGFFWFLSKYNDNVAVLQGVQSRIADQENKTLQGIQAAKRKRYYIETSPSSDVSDAKNQYDAWLKKTLREEIGVTLAGVDFGKNSTLKFESNVVAHQMSFSIRPTLTLKELVKFLDAFYSVDTLHRIKSMRLTPRTDGAGKKRTRSKELKATIDIEVLSLPDGIRRSQFQPTFRDPGITMETAMKTIVKRDMFDAANNLPSLKVNKSNSYTSYKNVSVRLTAVDVDEEDVLAMELIESEVDDAKLVIEEGGAKAKLNIPGQKAGKYKFLVRVVDDGLPVKSTDKEIQITFEDPTKPTPPTPERPPPPPIKMAIETRITGNLKNADGTWSVLIKSRMDGKSYRLSSGESFNLDDRDWKVVDITSGDATFLVDGQDVKVRRGEAFSEVGLAKVDQEPSDGGRIE
ncbi:hypothetical protein OAG71_01605 [bacterium]|nr:hypothetical protein [bacterium]